MILDPEDLQRFHYSNMQFVVNMSVYRNTTVKGKSLVDNTEVKGSDLMNISIFL